jgi:hypothetical protein
MDHRAERSNLKPVLPAEDTLGQTPLAVPPDPGERDDLFGDDLLPSRQDGDLILDPDIERPSKNDSPHLTP